MGIYSNSMACKRQDKEKGLAEFVMCQVLEDADASQLLKRIQKVGLRGEGSVKAQIFVKHPC